MTLVEASGDDGAPSSVARNGPKYCGYYADFPGVSYYVTSVGATMVRAFGFYYLYFR